MGLNQPNRVVLISGPAGFGKTILLIELASRLQIPPAWVSLDLVDNDPANFWAYLIAGCQKHLEGVGEAALAILSSPQPLPVEAVPASLINDIAGIEEDLVLVLDDFHVIQSETIHTAFTYLIDHLPGNLHLIVTTRVDPPWPLARLRARNQLVEIRAQDLRFTNEETALFLHQTMGLDLEDEDVSALKERTEGWIAGLQLAALSMQGHEDLSSFVKAFTGSHVYVADYLFEEVLKCQSQEIQQFLLKSSILDRLNPGLCEAVTGCENGRSMLEELYHTNLFLVPSDDEGEWYRYHRLFADLLQARLRREVSKVAISNLHQCAAAWYERVGMPTEAIEHSLAAENYPFALQLVEKNAISMIMKAHFKTVEGWLQAIPPEYLEENLQANMAFAWMHLMRRNYLQAAPHMRQLERIFSRYETGEDKDLTIEPALIGEWLALQSELLNAQGKAAKSRQLAEKALTILPENETQIRSMTYMSLADASMQMFDYEEAAKACEMIIKQGQATGDLASELFGLSYLCRMVLQQGMLHSAYKIATEALQLVEQSHSFSPFTATLYGELAQVYYSWHQLDKARDYFLRSVKISTLGGFSDAEIYHCVFLSRLFQMEGDMQASLKEIEKALDLMKTAAPALVNEEVIAQQISIFLAFDRLAEAQTALKTYGFEFEGEFSVPEIKPGINLAHTAGLLYDSALRILLYRASVRGELEALRGGIELANQVIEGSNRSRHLPIELKTYLLRAQMQLTLGDKQAALVDIKRALELGETEDFISIFIEEGEPVATTVVALQKNDFLGNIRPAYLQKILSTFSPKSKEIDEISAAPASKSQVNSQEMIKDQTLVESLTSREMDVLRLIADGCSNQTIAEKLVITVSAVKKHTGNIYGKLNVSSRTQSVARARQLGLLPPDR